MPEATAPVASLVLSQSSPASSWIGSAALGLAFGGQQIARGDAGESLRYTVIPLPVQPSQDVTMQARGDAVSATYTGYLQSAVDLYRLSVERNGFMTGVLDTLAHGLLGMPVAWQGDPTIISALADQDGTPGDYARMHPENECAKIFRDGVGLGFGLGQYLLMCWRCDGVDWNRPEPQTPANVPQEICRCCGAVRTERPVGQRELFQLRWRDARWLWRNPVTLQWYYNGRQAQVPVNPGDGEWLLFQTVPDQDVWTHGPWALGTEAAIFARDATYDQQNTSAVCAPAHVFQAVGGTGQDTRRDVEAQADNLRFGNKLVLPGEWKHEIHAAKAEFVDVCGAIVNWASNQWEVALTGNCMGQQSGTGFANMDVYQRVTTSRRRYYAMAWNRQVRAQGMVWYTLANFGTRNAPVSVSDCDSPEEKLARSKADEEEGVALKSLRDGVDAVGFELEPGYIQERMQRKGIRVRPKASSPQVAKIPLGVDGVSAAVRGVEARASLGLPPFGDARDNEILSRLVNSGASGGEPAPGAQPTPIPATVAAVGPPPGAGAAAPAARLDADEECDPDDEDCDGDARVALASGLAGSPKCEHGRTHACDRCGVQRVYGPPMPGPDGALVFPPPAWRPRARRAHASAG